jgi:hypothetical protein
MSDNHLIDRPARLIPCHGCRRHILSAISGGITIAADPEAADIHAEITARLSGRMTYDILILAQRPYLEYRSVFRIRPERIYPVVADHQCAAGGRPLYQLIPPKTPVKKKPAAKAIVREEEKCPF